ncbi:MAG: hypothetical protein L6Q71_01925, partial [Planctomycetes bacterium]|nr:hypothetical protein [Planctomycetota bacterium]
FQLEGNVHYASDPAFIEEFERDEFKENYPRRTFIFGRKDFLSHSFFIDVSPRIRPFTDEVERLPVAGFMTWREPVGPRSLGLLMSADGTAGYYRIQTADHDHPFNNYDFLRADTKLLLSRPMDFGLFSLEPGFGLRVTASDRKVTAANNPLYDPLLGFAPPAFGTAEVGEDIASRIQTVGYLDWQTNFVRTWPGEKGGLLGLNGLRHIVTLQNRWENVFSSSASASDFLQTDEVSALDPAQRLTMSVRNRFQTRRRIPGTNTWRTEDMLDVLAALPVYPNSARDNGGERLGDLEISAAAKPHPYVRVQSGTFWDTREFEWRRIYGTARVNVREDLALNLHWRLMESRHEVIGASFETLLSHNYAISARQDYDVRAGKFRDTVLTLARHTLDAFAINFTVRRDAILEDLNFGLSISGQFGPRRK